MTSKTLLVLTKALLLSSTKVNIAQYHALARWSQLYFSRVSNYETPCFRRAQLNDHKSASRPTTAGAFCPALGRSCSHGGSTGPSGSCGTRGGQNAPAVAGGRGRYSVILGSASTVKSEYSPRRNFSRATTAIIAALSVQAFCGGTVTRIP